MRQWSVLVAALVLLVVLGAGCNKSVEPAGELENIDQELAIDEELDALEAAARPIVPQQSLSDLVTVDLGGESLTFWPYTSDNYSGEAYDPVSLIFIGEADPLDIRAALMSLDGDRTALGIPSDFPFSCTWQDAIGGVQTTYAEPSGWLGSAIQMECGDHNTVRFHLRLFRAGEVTLGAVHFELLIPGTSEHQVLSWELAEQLVTADMLRSGLLDPDLPMFPTGQINDSPFRTIPAMIYNMLPVELRYAIGGPLEDVGADVGIENDGHALVFNLAGKAARQPGTQVQDFVIEWGQIIPKPFCSSGPYDYVRVEGPVRLYQKSELNSWGCYSVYFKARGTLTVTPVNPMTGEAIADPYVAYVRERHSGRINRWVTSASSLMFQKLTPSHAPGAGYLLKTLYWDDRGHELFYETVSCQDAPGIAADGDFGGGLGAATTEAVTR